MTWLAVLAGVVATLFAAILGVEHGKADIYRIQALTVGEVLWLPQYPGLSVRRIGTCDVATPAQCIVVELLQLDLTQAAVVYQPWPRAFPEIP